MPRILTVYGGRVEAGKGGGGELRRGYSLKKKEFLLVNVALLSLTCSPARCFWLALWCLSQACLHVSQRPATKGILSRMAYILPVIGDATVFFLLLHFRLVSCF